jgi:hypothetical protein
MADPNEARDGHVVIVVACCSRGPVAVLASKRPTWRCGGCRSTGTDEQRHTLGLNGALPGTFDPLADSPRCWKPQNPPCVRLEGHSGACRPAEPTGEDTANVEERSDAA